MLKRKRQILTAWVMALMLLFGALYPINKALAATPSSLAADVSVTGVADGGTIDGSTDIEVTVSFPVLSWATAVPITSCMAM